MKKPAIALFLFAALATAAFSDPAKEGLYLDQNVQASYDPLGLQFVTQLYYRVPLITSGGVLWEPTKVDFGVQNNLSPSYEMTGVFVTIEPIAVFSLTLTAQVAGFYNTFGFGFYDLSGYNAGFDDNSLNALPSTGTTGYVLSASPTLQFAVGPIVARDSGTLYYFNVDNGQGYFYERIGNVVLAKKDFEVQNEGDLLDQVSPELLVGLDDYFVYVPASEYLSHRLSAIGFYTRALSKKTSLYSALFLGTFLADRYFQYTVYTAAEVGITVKL